MTTVKMNLAAARKAKAKLRSLEDDLRRAKQSVAALQSLIDLAATQVQALHRTTDLIDRAIFDDVETHPLESASSKPDRTRNQEPPAWLRPKEAAKYLSISTGTLYKWVKTHPDFPQPNRLGGHTTVFSREEIDKYVRRFAAGQ
jgi:excisionase family DNA binding protein